MSHNYIVKKAEGARSAHSDTSMCHVLMFITFTRKAAGRDEQLP